METVDNAFTVINGDVRARNVNVVKPLQRDTHQSGRDEMVAVSPQTILDPKFSRALDFKLRRLKEKEVLEANLRRPTRTRQRQALAVSNPNICKEHTPLLRTMSKSQPRVDTISDSERTRVDKCKVRRQDDKPRFVTTVKTGQFLLPPPEVASLLGLETLYPPQEREKIVYSHSNRPKVVMSRSKRSVSEKPALVDVPHQSDKEKMHAGAVFKNVRALIAGVAGVKHLLEQRDHVLVNHFIL